MRSRGRGRVIPPSEKKYLVTLELNQEERDLLMSLCEVQNGKVKNLLYTLRDILGNIPEYGRKMVASHLT